MNIITGTTGEAHITPTQDAMWHRGLQGVPSGVFDVGAKFDPLIIDNNTVRVQDGCLSIQGRFACIDPAAYDDVTIVNGAQGVSRIDIICARLTIDRTQIPATTVADLYVFQGEESPQIPIAPEIPETDLDNADIVAYLPLIKVELAGIEIQNVSMIANVLHLGGAIQYDTALSDTSENAVQNKVVKNAIDTKTAPLNSMNSTSGMALRQSRLVNRDTTPSVNGQICWVYE